MKKILFLIVFIAWAASATDTVYCHQGLGTGDNDGSSSANAWQDIQTAFDNCGPDSVCLCYGTKTGATIDIDAKSGTHGSPIVFTGVNSSWEEESGVFFTIDEDESGSDCIDLDNSYYIIKNFRLTGSSDDLIDGSTGGDYTIFYNCQFDSSGDMGFTAFGGCSRTIFVNCEFFEFPDYPIYTAGPDLCVLYSSFHHFDKGAISQENQIGATIIGNEFYNGSNKFMVWAQGSSTICYNVFNGIGHASDTGIKIEDDAEGVVVHGNTFTNLSLGINMQSTGHNIITGNYFGGNDDDTSNVGMYCIFPYETNDYNVWGDAADIYQDTTTTPPDHNWLSEKDALRRKPINVGTVE